MYLYVGNNGSGTGLFRDHEDKKKMTRIRNFDLCLKELMGSHAVTGWATSNPPKRS